MIEENLLLSHGAKRVAYSRGDQLFRERESAVNFYQVASGEIKMTNPKVPLKITETLAKRLYYNVIMVSEISSQEPEHRILRIID